MTSRAGAAWRERDARLLLASQAVSVLGDGIGNVAFALLVLDVTHSPADLGWFSAARLVPMVALLLLGGALVDRVSRRALMVWSDLGRGSATLVIALLAGAHRLTLTEFLIFSVVFGSFDALFTPALGALIPDIVSEPLLASLNASRSLSTLLAGQLIGPALGGVLSAVSSAGAVGVDVVTFFISALGLMALRVTSRAHSSPSSASLWRDVREGLAYVRRTPWIWITLLVVSLINGILFSPSSVVATVLLRHTLHASKAAVGVVIAVGGLGGALGALAIGRLGSPRRRVRVIWLAWSVAALASALVAVAPSAAVVAVGFFAASPGIVIGNVIWESMMQSEVPRELLGRVTSVDWLLSLGLSPLGIALAGVLSQRVGPRWYLGVASAVSVTAGVLVLGSRRAHSVDRDR